MSVHIHINLGDLIKKAYEDSAVAAQGSNNPVTMYSVSIATETAAAKERKDLDDEIKNLTVKLHDAENTIKEKERLLNKKQIETSEAWGQADIFKMHFYRDKRQFAKEAEEAERIRKELMKELNDEKEQVAELLTKLELAETSKSRATERALAAEELMRQQKEEFERMNAHAEEIASEKKKAWNKLADDFDASTTLYKTKLQESELLRKELEKQLKQEQERALVTEGLIREMNNSVNKSFYGMKLKEAETRHEELEDQLHNAEDTLDEMSCRESVLIQNVEDLKIQLTNSSKKFKQLCHIIRDTMPYEHGRRALIEMEMEQWPQ
jgi:hypothetical protein